MVQPAAARRWQALLEEAGDGRIQSRVLTAFNTNVDVVVHLSPDKVRMLWEAQPADAPAGVPDAIGGAVDFLTLLKHQLQEGKSSHVVIEDDSFVDWLDRHFEDALRAMGGQAGIIANQMAALGARSIVYTPLLSKKQAERFEPDVVTPVERAGRLDLIPARAAGRTDQPTKVNWIFEYGAGERYVFGDEEITTPRANRVILATRPSGVSMAFEPWVGPHLEALGQAADVAFMAGYHYATDEGLESYLSESAASLQALRKGNASLRLHYEYVPMRNRQLEPRVLAFVGEQMHSLGINEKEICGVLAAMGLMEEKAAIESDERAATLYRGALALLRRLGLERIQLHNLGYYVMLLRKPYPRDPVHVRRAGLYATMVNAAKAKQGGFVTAAEVDEARRAPLSDIGVDQVIWFGDEFASDPGARHVDEGIWDFDDHMVLVVPAHVVPNPVSTVGMGDTISSASYAMEVGTHR